MTVICHAGGLLVDETERIGQLVSADQCENVLKTFTCSSLFGGGRGFAPLFGPLSYFLNRFHIGSNKISFSDSNFVF